MSYFNTTNLFGESLLKEINNAKRQEDKILLYFRANSSREMTPEEVQRELLPNTPITSIRRAFTVLKGKIVKVGRRKGNYGKEVHSWKLLNCSS